ncbi:MAG: choice-of-anchor D domain-containing protein [Pirellulaceae bacterium]|nr:choice-of-anchor D domain-containing protein [Pirellulaceae bacterium]
MLTTSVSLDTMNDVLEVIGDFASNSITISQTGGSILISDPDGVTADTGSGVVQESPTSASLPIASLQSSGQVHIHTFDGDDSVTFNNLDLQAAAIETAGTETVSIAASAALTAAGGVDLQADSITVGQSATISTRGIAGGDPLTAASTADSGELSLYAHTITIQPGARLLAQVEEGSTFSPGTVSVKVENDTVGLPFIPQVSLSHITITVGSASGDPVTILGGEIEFEAVLNNDITSPKRFLGYTAQTAEITIEKATIEGESVTLTAESEDKSLLEELPKWATANIIEPFGEFLVDKFLPKTPIGVMIREATAEISLTDVEILSEGNVKIDSSTTVDATTEAVAAKDEIIEKMPSHFSAGYSQAKGTSTTTLSGDTLIEAGGSVTIGTDAQTTAAVTARTTSNAEVEAAANPRDLVASLAITNSASTSHVTVDQDVTIMADGNISVTAGGKVTNKAASSAATYTDGLGGLSVSLAFDDSDVRAQVDGHLNGKGIKVARDLQIANVNGMTDSITIPDHGFADGERVQYFARDPDNPDTTYQPIGGLLNGETLRVIVIDSNTIQLARTEALDIDNQGANALATQTFARRDSVIFDPQTTVNTATDTITLTGHGFTAGQRLDYGVGSPDDDAIGGLADQNPYYAIPTGPNTFQLAASAADATAMTPVPIDLTSTGVGTGHIFAYDETPKTFNPVSDLDAGTNTFTIPGHGFATGDPLVYGTDPSVSSTQTMTRTAVFNTADQAETFDPTGTVDLDEPVVNLSTSTIALINHGLNTGEEVTYHANGGEPIGGLTDATNYFVIKVDDRYIQLAATAMDATNAVAITLEAGASLDGGPQELVTTGGMPVSIAFDPTGTVLNPVVNTIDDTILISPVHNLIAGQRVTYSAGGGTPIGGLTDGGDYFAIPITENTLRLAASRADALAGVFVDLSGGATGASHQLTTNDVDVLSDLIVTPGHELETGQQVTYRGGGGAAIGNLTEDTVYFAIRLDADTVQLAASLSNAAAGTAIDLGPGADGAIQGLERDQFVTVFDPSRMSPVVDTAADTIELPSHGLSTGDQVNYQTSGGTAIGGLADNTNYFVISVDPDHIQLAATAADAMANMPLPLGGGATIGSGLHLLRVVPVVSIPEFPDRLIDFNPTVVPPLNLAADTILLDNHGLTTGQSITYLSGSGMPIGGLVNGTEYFVIAVDDDTVQLAATAMDATNNLPINLDVGATGQRHGLVRESTVTQGDLPLRGLRNTETYFAIVLDANTFRLADSEQDALAAVAIDLDPSMATGTTHELTPLRVENGIQVGAELTADNRATSGAGLGGAPTWSDLLTKAELQTSLASIKAIGSGNFSQEVAKASQKQQLAGTGSRTNSLFAGAAGISLNMFEHDVVAQIGKEAVLQTESDVSIEASTSQKAQVTAQGNTSPGSGKKFATGVAVAIGIYDNNVQAIVDGDGTSGAAIDAGFNIDISSTLTYPLLVQPLTLLPFSSFYSGNINNANFIGDLSTLLNGSLGLTRIMNVWAASKVFTTSAANLPKVSISGSVGYTQFTNRSEAIVRSGAEINQNLQEVKQNVSIDAATGIELVNVTGIMHLRLNEAGLKKAYEDRQSVASFYGAGNFFSFFGNKSSTFGMGGSVMALELDHTTTALIEGGAAVHTGAQGGLSVEAAEDVYSLEFAQSGGDSGSVGISASIALVTQTSQTIAQIDSGAVVTGGPLSLSAESQLTHTNLAGAAQLANRLGIGVGVALLDVDRETAAIIGRRRTEGDDSPGNDGTSIDVDSITLEAKNTGNLWSFALVGALASNIPVGKPAAQQGNAQPVQATSGVALAGDAAINTISDTTQAYINDQGTIGSGAVEMNANNASTVRAITGAATFAAKPDGTIGGAVAGSFSYNDLTLTTEAFIAAAQITATGDVTLDATNDTDSLAVSAGLAGALAKSAVTIAGSFSWNEVTSSVEAYLDQVTLSTTAELGLTADDKSRVSGDGGGVAIAISRSQMGFGGAVAFGVSAAINNIHSTVNAYLQNSTVTPVGSTELTATGEPSIQAVTWAGSLAGGASGGTGLAISGAGAGSGNTIQVDVAASIGGSQVLNAGDVMLVATDAADIDSNAGGVALDIVLSGQGSNYGVDIGAAAAVNDLSGGTQATITSSTLHAGDLALEATSTSTIDALSIGIGAVLAGGDFNQVTFAAAGAGSGNTIARTIQTSVTGGNLTLDKLDVTATDDSAITADAGAGAAAASFSAGSNGFSIGFGAAVATNGIANMVHAILDSTTADVGGHVTLGAVETSHIETTTAVGELTVSLGGGQSALAFGGAGAGSGNSIANSVLAAIQNNSHVTTTAGGQVSLATTDTSTIDANAGAGALSAAVGANSGLAFAFGAAAATNEIENTIQTTINGSQVTSAGPVSVTASAGETIDVLTIGVGGALGGGVETAGVAFAGAGAGSGNTLETTVEASIVSSSHVSGTSLNVAASDTSMITADAGAGALAAAGGGEGGVSVGVGASVAVNGIKNTTRASVESTTAMIGGSVQIQATDASSIESTTAVGALSGAGGGTGGVAGAGAGASSQNDIANTTLARILGGSVTTTAGGNVSVQATETTSIDANAGAGVLAISGGSVGGFGVTVGAALVTNTVGNTIQALVDGANVTAAGNVSVGTTSSSTIDTLALGISAALTGGGGGGISLAGAGAGSTNVIDNDVTAAIRNSAMVDADGSVHVTSSDTGSITADAGGVAATISGGGTATASLSIGASTAGNSIGGGQHALSALIDHSTVMAGSGLNVQASSTATIDALAFGGAAAVSVSGGGAFAGTGAGASATNLVMSDVVAAIQNTAQASAAGDAIVSATDTSSITNNAVAGSLAISGSAGFSGSLGISAALATNTIQNTVQAHVDNATLTTTSGGDVTISATSTPSIDALAVAASVSVSVSLAAAAVSGVGASSDNTVANTVEAAVTSGGQVTADGSLAISASDHASLDADVGSGALSFAIVGASIGVSNTTTTLDNQVSAHVSNASATADGGDLSVTAETSATSTSTAVATSISLSIGGAGFGGDSSTTDTSVVEAYANSAQLMAPAGQVILSASSELDSDADSYGIGVGVAVVGVLLSETSLQRTTRAYVGEASHVGGLGLVVEASGSNDASSSTLNGDISALGGEGAQQTAEDLSVVDAYIGPADGSMPGASPAVVQVGSAGVQLNASLVTTVDATTDLTSIGILANGVGGVVTATVTPTVRAYIGQNSQVEASSMGDVVIEAGVTADVTGTGFGVAVSGGLSGGGLGITTTLNPTIGAWIGQNASVSAQDVLLQSALNIDPSTGLPNVGKDATSSGTAGTGALIASAAGVNATALVSPTINTRVYEQASVDATGHVQLASSFYESASAEADSTAVGGGAGVGTTIVSAQSIGTTSTRIDGTVQAMGSVSVLTYGTAEAMATGEANGFSLLFSGIFAGDGTNAGATVGQTGQTLAESAVGGQVTAGGDVTIQSLVDTQAQAETSGYAVSAGVSVGKMPATATVQPSIESQVESGGSVTSSGGTILVRAGHNYDPTMNAFLDSNKAQVSSSISVDSLAVSVASTTVTATASAAVDASLASGGSLSAPAGDVSILALSSNQADGTMDNNGGAAISYSSGQIQTSASGTTIASVLGSILGAMPDTPGAVNVNLTAQASDVASGDLNQSSGGVVNVDNSSVHSNSLPTVTATVDAAIRASSNVTVLAESFTDADGTIRGSSGGAVDVTDYGATVTVNPQVAASIATGASIHSDQTISVTATHGQPTDLSDGKFDAATDVNGTNNTIVFSKAHGLQTGATVTYDTLGNPAIPGIHDGRAYGVVVIDDNTLQLGDSFQAGMTAVNTTNDTITFPGPHNLETGDLVVYSAGMGTPVGGLTDGTTYRVEVVNATTIRLTDPGNLPEPPISFAGTDIMMDTITSMGHGFLTGQPVTYVAAAPATFSNQQVDVEPIYDGMQITGFTHDDMFENIFLGEPVMLEQGFLVGDTVIYTSSDPSKPIGGLTSGNRYVLLIDPMKSGELQLAETATPTMAIALTQGSMSDSTVQHTLLKVEDQPISPLVSQQTYYVANAMPNTFQLAPTLADALGNTNLIMLAPTDPADPMHVLTGTRNLLGTTGIDLTSTGNGTQFLVLDIAPSSGEQQLDGIGGAQSVSSASSNDGIATASVSSGGGGVIDVDTANTTANSTPHTSVTIGGGALLAGLNVAIAVSSAGNVGGSSANTGGGFVSVKGSESQVSVNNSALLTISDTASLQALNKLGLATTASQFATVDSSTDEGAFAAVPSAESTAKVDYSSQINIGDAMLTAGGTLSATSHSDVNAQANASANGSGAGSGASANNSGSLGVFIGKHGGAFTRTNVGSNAILDATAIDLTAGVTSMYGRSTATAKGSGVGGNSQAKANLEISDDASVILNSGSMLAAPDVTLLATHDNIDLLSHSNSRCDCGAGADDSTANTDYQSTSQITAGSGAIITTADLDVQSNQHITQYRRDEQHGGGFLVFGSHDRDGHYNANRNISWNATVRLPTNPDPTLVVDSTGLVVTLDDVTLNGDTIHQGDVVPSGTTIIVDDIINDMGGMASFAANRLAEMDDVIPPVGTITGSQGEFDFNRTLDTILLSNASDRDMTINDIRVYFAPSPTDKEVSIDVQNDAGFSFDVVNDLSPTQIEIENTHPTAGPLLSLDGLIDNPIGTTTVSNASGDIVTGPPGSPAGVVRTNVAIFEAPLGNLGQIGGAPLVVELVQSAGRPTSLVADAGQDVALNVQGLLRETGVSSFEPNLDRITAGGDVQLVLAQGLLQTMISAAAEGVRVFESSNVGLQPKSGCTDSNNNSCFNHNSGFYPAIASPQFADNPSPPRTSTVETHWPPSSGDPPPPASDLGIFGGGNTPIETTYTFTGTFTWNAASDTRRVQAAGDILIDGCQLGGCTLGDVLVHVLGNVNLVSDLNLPMTTGGVLSMHTNGSIDMTEVAVPVGSNRSMRVGTIVSTADSVRLTVPDTLAAGEDLILLDSSAVMPDGSLIGAATTVTLQVGDNVLMQGNALSPPGSSRIEAGTTVTIAGDFGNADPGVGTVIDLRGQITGNLGGSITDPIELLSVALITGGSDADIVSLTNVTSGTGTTVQTFGDDDLIQVGSSAAVDVSMAPPIPTNTGGVLHAVLNLLTIDGGAGDDTWTADDSGDSNPDMGVLTFDTLTGFQMTDGVHYTQIEVLLLTMGQAGDTLDVDSTNSTTDSQVFGNAGDDTINVSKLPALPLAGNACLQITDTVDCIQGVLRVDGGADYDTLNVVNTGQTSSRSGTLTGTSITGLNMGPDGITYSTLEAIDILLGQAADMFLVSGTATPQPGGNTTISAVHGGGGADQLTVTGGGGAQSPLVIYGDYTGTGTPDDDLIDASAASQTIMVDGNEGHDIILGSQAGDNLAGSAGDDMIQGQGGTDNILGDSGFEVNLRTRVTSIITTHPAGQDLLEGQDGNDRLFGDHAVLIPVPGALLVTTTVELATFETVNENVGDNDRLLGGPGDDFVLGGQGDDTLFGNEGHDHVLGDNGRFDFVVLGMPPGLNAVYTPQPMFGGNDNIFGDSGNDDDPAGNDFLYDGPSDDELDGGPGDDTFRLTPGNEAFGSGSRDYLSDIRGNDTIDFTYAMIRSDCLTPATATDLCGIMIDMDLLSYTDAAFSQAGPDARLPISDDVPQHLPQDPAIDDRLSLVRIGAFGQSLDTPSPFESVIGSYFNDTFWIRALTTGGDIPENGPPVARNVNGNPPVVGDAAVPPGDKLYFDGQGQVVLDTGFSLTALGIGTVTYQSIETLCVFDQAPRILDDGDDTYFELPTTAVANISPLANWNPVAGIGFGGDYRYHQPQTPPGPNTATWTFEGVTPGNYRVSVTWPAQPSHPIDGTLATNAPFSVRDDNFLLASRGIDQRVPARDFLDQGVYWQDLGIFPSQNHSLVVQLSDLANGQVMADAVRIEYVAHGPSLRVLQNVTQQAILNDITIVPMVTTMGAPLSRTFVIHNQGDQDLEVDEINLTGEGAGNYALQPGPSAFPVVIPPGETLAFTVTLRASAAEGFGPFPAQVEIVSNDMSTSVPRKPGAGMPTGDPAMDVSPYRFALDGLVSTQRIIDDGDPDFSLVGVWQGPNGPGFQGDDRYAPAGGNGARAVWTFGGLPDGIYRVSTSYDAQVGGSTMAPFRVLNSGGLIGSAAINQTLSPQALGGFADSGRHWIDLGGPYELTGGTLIVNLLDTAGQPDRFVLADAVRIERLFPDSPDIVVQVDGQPLPLGGTVDFGGVFPDLPVLKTFTVTNAGTDPLTISEPVQLPPGFSLVEFDGQTPTGQLTATAPTSFVLRMEGGFPGAFQGQVSFADNDPDENPFSFFVTGEILSSRIIDDQDATGFAATAGFGATGTGLSAEEGFQRRVHFASGNPLAATEMATWTFEDLAPGRPYRVSATWSPAPNRATNSPFTLSGIDDMGLDPPNDSDGSLTVLVNQQLQPDDLRANGTLFEDLGIVTVTGTTLTVTLSNQANGLVIADAMRLQPIDDPLIELEQGGQVLQSGASRVDFGAATVDTMGGTVTRTFTIRNLGTRSMALGAPTLPVGFSLVGVYPSSIPVGQSADFVVAFSRAAAGAYDGLLEIPADDLSANPFLVRLTGSILAAGTIIDNSDGAPGYTSSGLTTYTGQGRSGSVQGATGGDGSRTATYTFAVPPGLYRVSATWSTYYTRATNTPYAIFDGTVAGTPLGTHRVNQQVAPDSFADSGSLWRDLDVVRITSGTLTVRVSNDANGDVVADAIRIEPLPEQPEISLTDSLGNELLTGGTFDFGAVAAGSTATETFTVRNLGTSPLELGALRLPVYFELASPLGTTTLAPFDGAATNLDETTFEVRFAPPYVDQFLGDLRLGNNDSNENPFELLLAGNVQAAVTIIDDGDPPGPPGYQDTGFQVFAGQGYQGDVRQSLPGAGHTATWTFDVTPDTTYRVAATWTGYPNRASNAPYTIAGIAGGEDVVFRVDQRSNPNDFEDTGVPWETLAVVRTTGSTLTVTLGDNANGNVIADAIRLEELPTRGPAILVSDGPVSVPDNTGLVTLSTAVGSPVVRTFNVVNMGTAPLTLDNASLQLSLAGIAGFDLVGTGFGSSTLAPGQATTFSVQLNAAAKGSFGGTISFGHGDPTESPYDFTISGVVESAFTIIDNDDPPGPPGYGDSGNWQLWNGQGYKNDVREALAGGAVETAAYTFDVTAGAVYQVSATWTAFTNRATNAPYSVSGVTQPATVPINQRVSPNDFTDSGAAWERLGTFTASGSSLVVTLSGSTTGNVIADAVRIDRVVGPEIQVLAGMTEIADGTGSFNFGTVLAGATNGTRVITVNNVGVENLVLQPIMVSGGFTLDTSTYPNFMPNQVLAPGASVQFAVAINTATTGSKTGNVSFGNNDVDEGPFSFSVLGQVVGALIIDDGDAVGYSDSANMQVWAQGYQNDVREAVLGGAVQSASYTFAGLPSGTYRISATWTAFSNRASNAPYTINGAPVAINQKLPPSNPSSTPAGTVVQDPPSGVYFADLNSSYAFAGGTLLVGVSDVGANGNVIIDAVRVERLSPLRLETAGAVEAPGAAADLTPTLSSVLNASDVAPLVDAAIEFWTGRDPLAADRLRDVRVIIQDLPQSQLGLGSRVTPTIWLDDDAAGQGWAIGGSNSGGSNSGETGIDLLTVVAHELGHVLGLDDLDASAHPDDIMAGTLAAGVRRAAAVDELFDRLGQD